MDKRSNKINLMTKLVKKKISLKQLSNNLCLLGPIAPERPLGAWGPLESRVSSPDYGPGSVKSTGMTHFCLEGSKIF